MNRRAFVFASLSASLAVATASGAARAASDIKVIYVGGLDCEPCTRWKTTYKAKWLASPEYREVTWVEVESPRLRDAYQRRFWPGDLGSILDQLPRKNVTPRFLIVEDGQVVDNQAGTSKWTTIMSDLKRILDEHHAG
jgi:hypothetical protein